MGKTKQSISYTTTSTQSINKDYKTFISLCDKLLKTYENKNINEILKELLSLANLKIPDNIDNINIENKKQFNNLIEQIVKLNINNKEKVEAILDIIYKLGHCRSTFKNFTLTIDDFLISEELYNEFYTKISNETNIVSKYHILQEYIIKAINDLKNKNSRLIKIINSGLRANINQLQQVILSRGIIDTGLRKYFITGNYANGLTIDEYIKSAEGARKSIYDKTISTAKPGYLTRQFVYILHPYKFTKDDCGTNKLLKLPYKKFGKKWFIDKYYLNPKTNKIELFTENTEYEFDYILIRSVLYCNEPVCKTCYGRFYHNYSQIGIITAQTLGERGTQLTLRAFHTGSAYDLPQETALSIEENKDIVYINNNQELVLKNDAYIELPQHLILLKNNLIISDFELKINNKILKLSAGMKLYINKSDYYLKDTIIAKLDVSNIGNIITLLEALLRKRIVFNKLDSLIHYLDILRELFSHSGSFHLGMIELLVRATIDKENNINDFPVTKLPISLIPHIKGYGCTFEKARTALIYNFLLDHKDDLSEKYDLFKYTNIKGVAYYLNKE